MIKYLILIAACFLLYKLFIGDKKFKKEKGKTQEDLIATGELVKDPVCGTYVSRDNPIRVKDGDAVHSFCSYQCRDKYLKQIGALESEVIRDETEKNG